MDASGDVLQREYVVMSLEKLSQCHNLCTLYTDSPPRELIETHPNSENVLLIH